MSPKSPFLSLKTPPAVLCQPNSSLYPGTKKAVKKGQTVTTPLAHVLPSPPLGMFYKLYSRVSWGFPGGFPEGFLICNINFIYNFLDIQVPCQDIIYLLVDIIMPHVTHVHLQPRPRRLLPQHRTTSTQWDQIAKKSATINLE